MAAGIGALGPWGEHRNQRTVPRSCFSPPNLSSRVAFVVPQACVASTFCQLAYVGGIDSVHTVPCVVLAHVAVSVWWEGVSEDNSVESILLYTYGGFQTPTRVTANAFVPLNHPANPTLRFLFRLKSSLIRNYWHEHKLLSTDIAHMSLNIIWRLPSRHRPENQCARKWATGQLYKPRAVQALGVHRAWYWQ